MHTYVLVECTWLVLVVVCMCVYVCSMHVPTILMGL